MEKLVLIENIATSGAVVNTNIPCKEIESYFHNALEKSFQKLNFICTGNEKTGSSQNNIRIGGSFVVIDEGSRYLRYFVGVFGAGKGKVEVEIQVMDEQGRKQEFAVLIMQGPPFLSNGLFGGNGHSIVKEALKKAAHETAIRVSAICK